MLSCLLKVISVKTETHNAVTISFKQPALKKIKYLPGQYLTVIVNINNRKYKRAYSISSAPGIDEHIEITVKRVAHGIVSNHLIDELKAGDFQEIITPMGDFIYDVDAQKDKDIYLWAAGSGITPLMSILKIALKCDCKVTLTYVNKSEDETIFLEDLTNIKKQHEQNFSLNLFYTKQSVSGAINERIAAHHIKDILELSSNKLNVLHYICGVVAMKNLVKEVLLTEMVSKSDIFSEDFEKVLDEAQLEDIKTEMVILVKDGEPKVIEVVRGKSILEAGLDFGLDLSYSCQTGSCKLCKAYLKAGRVKVIAPEDLEILDDNMYLLCCCYPLNDKVICEI